MSQPITELSIVLSKDEALVLFEFFARFENTNEFSLHNNAEYLAFSRISAQLDKVLIEPLDSNYQAVLKAAQLRVTKDYEGPAPGVNS